MNKLFMILIIVFVLTLTTNIVSASDVLVWQGQYYTGTTFNTGTYEFNFSVYDALTGGNSCYSNTTTLTTGNFGDWETEEIGVNSACNNISKDYFLEIKIDNSTQGERRRLVVWNSLRKNVDEVSTGNLVLNGSLQSLLPLKLQDEINFLKSDGTITSALYNAPRAVASSLPSAFADSLIHDIIQETNDYGMQECFWDENTETMQMCISGAYLTGRATTISRSLQVVGNTSSKPIDENFTLCAGNNYVDCEADATGADFLVEDDIEAIGSIFSQENITADDTGFFSFLGSLTNRITKLWVVDINATGNLETSENVSAKYFKGDGSLLTGIGSSSTNLTNYALKNQSETFAGNITTTETGFFGLLGSLTSRITKLWVQDIDVSGNLNITGNITGITKEIFYPAETAAANGNFRVRSVGATGNFNFNIFLPNDFSSLESVVAVGIISAASTAGTEKDIDLNTDCGGQNQAYNFKTQSDTTSTYTTPALNTLWEMNVSGVFSDVSSGDYCGLNIDHNSIGGSIDYLGIKLRYKT